LVGGINYNCNSQHNYSQEETSASKHRQAAYDCLIGSKKEVYLIQPLVQNQQIGVLKLEDCAATKIEVLRRLEGDTFTHVHISTHGVMIDTGYEDVNQLFSSNMKSNLLLASEHDNIEPMLSAFEVINYDFSNKSLVFLSTCYSGYGYYMPGYGNASIANAFKKAGAKKVVATLWPIPDDVTVELCAYFYTHYLQSHDVNAALKHAKRQLRKNYSPEKWAAFRVMN
jgi:CHAT domain-containing protein